jgi:hypothetical protein
LEAPSCAVGVGNIPTVQTVGVGGLGGKAEQEHAFAAVGGADVGGADATPQRVIPCLGQVAENRVEAAVFPAQGGDVFHHEQLGS